MSTVSVSLDQERLQSYSVFATTLRYPDEIFFQELPSLSPEKEKIISEYDTLFRRQGIWLYTTEYTAPGQFQKIYCLADIMGFYRAFGLTIDRERPDSLSVELEFMHYLIFKANYATRNRVTDHREKNRLCSEAQGKFFAEHLYPGALAIAEKIATQAGGDFYRDVFEEMLLFLEKEKEILK